MTQAFQLQLFSINPVMIFECPCGEMRRLTWNESVSKGWNVPSNMRDLERDGRHIIAICRACSLPYATRCHWRWSPIDRDVFHWLQRQEETPNLLYQPHAQPIQNSWKLVGKSPLKRKANVCARHDITFGDGTRILAGHPGRLETAGDIACNVWFKGYPKSHLILCMWDMLMELPV